VTVGPPLSAPQEGNIFNSVKITTEEDRRRYKSQPFIFRAGSRNNGSHIPVPRIE
jgi:hypothetical protein